MAQFTKVELENAFKHYRAVKDECSRSGDWHPFALLFTKDCYYVEHAYGEFRGRNQVERYIVDVMAPFPTMTFVEDWIVYDVERGAIIWQLQNVFPLPNNPENGKPFSFPNLSRLVYAGNNLFSEEQDWYNPNGEVFGVHAKATTKAWRKAGGKFLTTEKLKMMHSKI
jgi:hypothetical protein